MDSTWQNNKLYILLLSRGAANGTFHWSLFLTEGNGGTCFHVIDSGPKGQSQWRLERKQSLGVYEAERLVAALEVGEDVQGLRSAIDEATNEVWNKADTKNEHFNCRKFTMDCLAEFDQRGIIAVKGSTDQIQGEALSVGMRNDPSLNPTSQGGQVYKSLISK